MVKDSISVKGSLHIVIVDEHGNIKTNKTVPNLVVDSGKNFLAAALGAVTTTTFEYMAVGTGTTAAAGGQTALVSESARVSATPSISANVATYTGVFGAGVATGTLAEAGIFSAASLGTMFSRSLIGPTTKGSNDTMTITWTITAG